MPLLVRNHRLPCWNTLLLCAFMLAAGCSPDSSSSGQSQQPAAAAIQPAAETVTQATGPVPETLWDKRAEYEKEGQVVLFTDCGLYKGDTDELTGAKCVFKDGRWVLLEPKPEQTDNLCTVKDFTNQSIFTTEGRNPSNWYISNATAVVVHLMDDPVYSKPYSLYLSCNEGEQGGSIYQRVVATPGLKFDGKYVSAQCWIKKISGDDPVTLSLGDFVEEKITHTIQNVNISSEYGKQVITRLVRQPLSINQVIFAVGIEPANSISLDDIFIIQGYLPMGW